MVAYSWKIGNTSSITCVNSPLVGGGLPYDGDKDTHHLRWEYDYGPLSGWKTTLVDRSLNRTYTVPTVMMSLTVIIFGP